jgi:hypothetical protein
MAAEPLTVLPEGEDDDDQIQPSEDTFAGGDFLTFMQVVKRYGISRQSLHTLCMNREVPYYTGYNGRRRFMKEEVDQYLGLRRVAPKAKPRARAKPKTLAAAGA